MAQRTMWSTKYGPMIIAVKIIWRSMEVQVGPWHRARTLKTQNGAVGWTPQKGNTAKIKEDGGNQKSATVKEGSSLFCDTGGGGGG